MVDDAFKLTLDEIFPSNSENESKGNNVKILEENTKILNAKSNSQLLYSHNKSVVKKYSDFENMW